MLKKVYNLLFIIAFLAILSVPLLLADYSGGEVSENENRYLADFPKLMADGKFNESFTAECESWFRDHMGLRKELVMANAALQYHGFQRMLNTDAYYIGASGDINYATHDMLQDYAHANLRTDKSVANIGNGYQTVSNWLDAQGIPFYYVQCYDKHSIYPEQFMDTVNQYGDISKTDQILSYLETNTTVKAINLKQPLLDSKGMYEVYSNWGDPSHWTPRGAYIGYQYIMEYINNDMGEAFRVLAESDYEITVTDQSIRRNWISFEEDMLEKFTLKAPQAQTQDKAVMGKWAEDERHRVFSNEHAGNDTKLLLMCDSYFNNYLVDDFAESFSEVWVVWGDYTDELPEIVEFYQPDLVIYECAERVDRSYSVYNLAQALNEQKDLVD